QLGEVVPGPQNGGALVVDVEERLQVGEPVGPLHGFHVAEGELDAVSGRQVEHQLRFERALDVDVELRLGERDQILIRHRATSSSNAMSWGLTGTRFSSFPVASRIA